MLDLLVNLTVFLKGITLVELMLDSFDFALDSFYFFPGFAADSSQLLKLFLAFLIELHEHFDLFFSTFSYLVVLLLVVVYGLIVPELVMQSGDRYSAFLDPVLELLFFLLFFYSLLVVLLDGL